MREMAVVIVNHNTREQLRACLDTIPGGASREVIVVDNASRDGSAEMVLAAYPWVRLIANQANAGYGAGANQGIAAAVADYILLLNSDTRLTPGTLAALSCYLDDHPRVGLVGPRLSNLDGTLQPSCYSFPTPGAILLQESGLGRWIRLVPILRGRDLRSWSHDRPRAVPWVLGAALAIRRAAFDAVGGFDERIFMYYEETDLSCRLTAAGWQIHFAPVTTVTHIGGASTSQRRAEMTVELYASLRQLYRRQRSPFELWRLNLVVLAVMLARLARDSARLRRSRSPAEHARIADDLAGWQRVLRGKPSARRAAAPAPSLRRADWRFVLPKSPKGGFETLVLLDAPAGLAEQLVGAGVAGQVLTALPDCRCADAVVLLGGNATPSRVRRAADALVPGGALYCEVDRRWSLARLRASPGAMRRTLCECSFGSIRSFWPAPSLERANKYVPLDAPGAVRWYLATICIGGTPLRSLAQFGIAAVAAVAAGRLGALLPWYALTAVAGPTHNRLPAVFDHDDFPPEQRRPNIAPLLLTSGQDDGSRVVILPFIPGNRRPEYVVKVARRPELNTNVEEEQHVLAEVRGRLDAARRSSVPRPLALFRDGGLAVSLESYAPGRSLFVLASRWRASDRERIADLRLALDWLAAFNRQTQFGTPESGAAEFARRVGDRFDQFTCAFDATPAERQLLTAVQNRAVALTDAPLPFVWQHHDFGPWNLYRDGNQLQVIDWELGWGPGFDRAGPALCDALYFITHWSFAARGLHTESNWLDGFDDLFIKAECRDALVAAARSATDEYLTALGIDRRFLPLVLVYTWVERALRRLDRRRLLGNVPVPARAGDQFVSYVSHLADHAPALLGPFDETAVDRAEIGSVVTLTAESRLSSRA